ncbi:MAG: VanZ family protein [Oscillospiraceae bacterium]|nr:VanZ family protein [Oscillospiraceae bacterium]
MIYISYNFLVAAITILWILVRAAVCIRQKGLRWKREAQLILVYICIVVVARFTFFPFGKVDGQIQPLVFDTANAFPPRINLLPFVYMTDYPTRGEILLNFIGNTAMFLPLGIVWPSVFKKLDTHTKVIAAGVGCSLLIEILQLPFFDRVSDIDDLILNTLGFLAGYGIYLLVKSIKKRKN